MKGECESCVFWRHRGYMTDGNIGGSEAGICYRYPPAAGATHASERVPWTRVDHWCGEYVAARRLDSGEW